MMPVARRERFSVTRNVDGRVFGQAGPMPMPADRSAILGRRDVQDQPLYRTPRAQMDEKTGGLKRAASYRAANEQDVDALVRLVNAAYRPTTGAAGWTHEASLIDGPRMTSSQLAATLRAPDSVLLVAEIDGSIAGCIEVRRDGNAACLGTLAVAPSMQDRGLGKALLNEAEQFAVRHWKIGTAVMVVLSVRHELIDFYLRRGYTRTGERMGYPFDAGVGVPRDDSLTIETLTRNIARD
ncbi:TPA: GNAT family N-acetyltransferase [Burkholderia aenigmatica]|uniref:GNAT family N-acetyltransferase n=1 Tax=Burkholderia sp. AU45251 TaxID=3059204 RepID=UPI0026502C36|nr:GNAT family N-acetyltransferase [Burkholderia sp. AU45251]HDR9482001.1 GNAT family N-acetyltransferase [Burkholderia aenigmatica]MDN7515367.1 GNAT family N-acetyltransferase [Burkholderia sp. AU45251]HDR9515468.1 GNAT family N-acetyltransferase [Burkholderia aenigmatica]HDR9590372.1 GNAT family N-acetyltransferase [Burkholderia aenigmatica]HDR9598745.1 GNAT family N-acetyltransferase [Burkholderia aenigmatica]